MDSLTLDMLVFAKVVETGNFTAAAKSLGIAKSSVSKRIASLESNHRVRLIQRTTRQINITEDGLALYEYCQRLEKDLEEARNHLTRMTAEPSGRLRISAPPLFSQTWLTPMIPQFLQNYPSVQLELHLTDERSELIKDGYDLLIRMGALEDSTMIGQQFSEVRPQVCASKEYLSRRGIPTTPSELRDHNCLLWKGSSNRLLRDWSFTQNQNTVTVPVNGNFVSNNPDAIKQSVKAGVGIAILPSYFLDPDMVPLLTDYQQPAVPVYILYGHRTQMAAKQRVFIDSLKFFQVNGRLY